MSTALRASSAAASITDGLDVLVQDVIEAIDTAPWSSSNSRPSSVLTCTGLDGRPWAPLAADTTRLVSVVCESACVKDGRIRGREGLVQGLVNAAVFDG